MSDTKLDYFRELFARSLRLIEQFPLTITPPRMNHITGVLEPSARAAQVAAPFSPPPAIEAAEHDGTTVGLNTVGMLLDRLSILAVKHWNLVNRRGDPAKAKELIETQVEELVRALTAARPGFSSLNNKMTNRRVEAAAVDFPEAYSGLLSTNLLLWEAQEILYNHDITMLPCEELRAYIDFFSRGNLQRNVFIESSDSLFWHRPEPIVAA
jgi:hypothetical protein